MAYPYTSDEVYGMSMRDVYMESVYGVCIRDVYILHTRSTIETSTPIMFKVKQFDGTRH